MKTKLLSAIWFCVLSGIAFPTLADKPSSSAASSSKSSSTSAKPSVAKEAETMSPAVKGSDRLELDTTRVTGSKELPKVLYIVPWKRADVGNLPGQPFNTLLDEALAPVDREVFRREVDYYQAYLTKISLEKGMQIPVMVRSLRRNLKASEIYRRQLRATSRT